MKKTTISITIALLLLVTFISCSKDNDEPVCLETNITMKINGELQNFQAIGRGIDLRQNDYELSINLDRRSDSPFREQTFYISLPYKKTGINIFEKIIYHQYINNTLFEGDFVNGELQSKVITNTNKCFYATFSGKLNDGNQEVNITEGSISYQYESPFD